MMASLFNHLWQSTVFAAGVWLLSLTFRHNRARLRYALWFAASVKFLVPFTALAALGGMVAWRQPPAPLRLIAATPIVRDLNAPFAAIFADGTPMAVATPGYGTWIVPACLLLWVGGCAAIAVRRVAQWRVLRAAVHASTPWPRTTPSSGVPIRVTATVMEPGLVGFRRPVILLPSGVDAYLTNRQLEAVVAHELCHARRRDNLTAAVHMVVEAAFWFHPIVWWIGARLVAEREQACDEHVVAETADPVVYAEGIVNICRRYLQSPAICAGVGGADVKARIENILSNRIGARLTSLRRVGLATAAALSLAIPLVTGAVERAAFAAGQLGNPLGGPAADLEARFEVASIKPFDPSTGGQPVIGLTPTQFAFGGALPLRAFINQGLRAPIDRIFGWPDWVDSAHYTVTAKIPAGSPPSALPVMIENLLKDRFKLASHREMRELPVYNLVLARGDRRLGPALKDSPASCQAAVQARLEAARRGEPVPATPPAPQAGCMSVQIGLGTLGMTGTPIASFLNILTRAVDRPVIDRTGLTGLYDLTLKYTPDQSGGPAQFGVPAGAPNAPPPSADPDSPNIFTAVQEQLGLKLEAGRGPVGVVVIDHLEKPTVD